MRRYDVVTLDMGYTLVYFHPSEIELTLCAYRSLGLNPDPQALRRAQDEVWAEYNADDANHTFEASEAYSDELEIRMHRRILARLGYHDERLPAALFAACKAVFAVPGTMRVYPEVVGVLRSLRAQGYALGVISNWSWDLADYVRWAGLNGYFNVVVASACAGCDKPHAAIFRQALQTLGCRPERALHIGDNYAADVVGARNAGMDALWLDREGRGGHPDCRSIRDLRELVQVLEGRDT